MKKPVLCCGEVLVDFIAVNKGKSLEKSTMFEKKAGGAPFNVAVGLVRLGKSVEFLGKLGGDQFSQFLLSKVREEGISTRYLKLDRSLKTTLVFVARDTEGKPDFVFFRDNPADANVTLEDVDDINPEDFSLLHVGSIAMVFDPTRKTLLKLVEDFYFAGIPVSYDPNVRASLIFDRERFIRDFYHVCSKASIVKLSDADMDYIFPGVEYRKALVKIPLKKGTALFLTRGAKGCTVFFNGKVIDIPAFEVEAVDTTGCGDAFMAGLIHKMVEKGLQSMDDVKKAATFASAAAAIVATRIGGADSMPGIDEVKSFIGNTR